MESAVISFFYKILDIPTTGTVFANSPTLFKVTFFLDICVSVIVSISQAICTRLPTTSPFLMDPVSKFLII